MALALANLCLFLLFSSCNPGIFQNKGSEDISEIKVEPAFRIMKFHKFCKRFGLEVAQNPRVFAL